MTKRLILMRHAKSDWDDPLLSDFERPLNRRGRDNAVRMGGWLKQHGFLPDAVLCSAAARTRETFALLDIDASVTFEQRLYLAPAQVMLRCLKTAEADTILMIGHNPGIAEFAHGLLAKAPDHVRFHDFPTCSTLVCDLPISKWADAVSRSAQVVDFIVPRDLSDQ